MPLFECDECHNKWEGSKDQSECDWCHKDGIIVELKSALENMLSASKEFIDVLDNLKYKRNL